MVFFLQFSKKGLFLCLFIIMFCLISRKRQKLRNRSKRTLFSIHQYLSNGTKTKPLAPTFFLMTGGQWTCPSKMRPRTALCELDNIWWCRLVDNTHLQDYKKEFWKNVKYFGHGKKLKSRPSHYWGSYFELGTSVPIVVHDYNKYKVYNF